MSILFTRRRYIRYLCLCNRYSAQGTTQDESIRHAEVKARRVSTVFSTIKRIRRSNADIRLRVETDINYVVARGLIAFFLRCERYLNHFETMLFAKRSGGLRLSVTDTVSQPARRASTDPAHVSSRDCTPKSVHKSRFHVRLSPLNFSRDTPRCDSSNQNPGPSKRICHLLESNVLCKFVRINSL